MVWPFKRKQFLQILLALAIIVGLLLTVILGFKVYSLFSKNSREENRVYKDTYQAVFLDNNQIYFGHLNNIDSQYPLLNDVYYVKLEGNQSTTGRLVKLGEGEPHGPQNQMILNREHILFWENLKPDSQVVQTIRSLELQR